MTKKKYNYFKLKSNDKGTKKNTPKKEGKKIEITEKIMKPAPNPVEENNVDQMAAVEINNIQNVNHIETTESKEQSREMEEIITFFVGEKEYAIDILLVKEIIIIDKVEKVSNAEKYIEGLYNYRGEIIPLINLGKKFNIETKEKLHVGIVCNHYNQLICLVTYKVNDVLNLKKVKIFDPPALIAGVNDYLYKIVKIYDGSRERIISVLNFDNIFSSEEQTMLKKLTKN